MIARVALRDASLRAALDRDGFAVADFLPRGATALLLDVWEHLSFDGKDAPFSGSVASADTAYRRAVHDAISAAVKPRLPLLFDGARFAYGNFVAKHPGGASALAFHRDPWFTDERAWEWLTLWIPLCDVAERNGCLHVVPGSQRGGAEPRPANAPPVFDVSAEERATLVRAVPMRAGQVCIMRETLIHGSPANGSRAPRVAASGLVTSAQAQLAYVHRDARDGAAPRTLLYHVSDDFFLTHLFDGRLPAGTPVAELA